MTCYCDSIYILNCKSGQVQGGHCYRSACESGMHSCVFCRSDVNGLVQEIIAREPLVHNRAEQLSQLITSKCRGHQ